MPYKICTHSMVQLLGIVICVGARENMTFGLRLSCEKNEAVLTACYFVILTNIKMPHESLETVD